MYGYGVAIDVRHWMNDYFRTTKSGTYGFIMALPLLLGYEVLMLLTPKEERSIRISAEVLLKLILSSYVRWGFVVALIIIGIAIFYRERDKGILIKPEYFAYMLGESILWVPIFTITVGYLSNKASLVTPSLAAGGVNHMSFLGKLGISMGAGVYEEFVFRLCLVGLFCWIGSTLFPTKKPWVFVISSIISALIFSAVHHIGAAGDPFTISVFIYRTIAGLVLNALFLSRGFGIAAWTHALFDMVVLLHQG